MAAALKTDARWEQTKSMQKESTAVVVFDYPSAVTSSGSRSAATPSYSDGGGERGGQTIGVGDFETEGVAGRPASNGSPKWPPKTKAQSAPKVSTAEAIRIVEGMNRPPTRRSLKGGWTGEEDDMLRIVVIKHGERNWESIAKSLNSSFSGSERTNVQCMHRWQKVLQPGLKKGLWTKHEDQMLTRLVAELGANKWGLVEKQFPGRIGKQCRERWLHHINPDINKNPWTEQEEEVLDEAHSRIGNKWAAIAKYLPGRTNNDIKNHYRSMQRRTASGKIGQGKTRNDASASYQAPSLSAAQPSTPRAFVVGPSSATLPSQRVCNGHIESISMLNGSGHQNCKSISKRQTVLNEWKEHSDDHKEVIFTGVPGFHERAGSMSELETLPNGSVFSQPPPASMQFGARSIMECTNALLKGSVDDYSKAALQNKRRQTPSSSQYPSTFKRAKHSHINESDGRLKSKLGDGQPFVSPLKEVAKTNFLKAVDKVLKGTASYDKTDPKTMEDGIYCGSLPEKEPPVRAVGSEVSRELRLCAPVPRNPPQAFRSAEKHGRTDRICRSENVDNLHTPLKSRPSSGTEKLKAKSELSDQDDTGERSNSPTIRPSALPLVHSTTPRTEGGFTAFLEPLEESAMKKSPSHAFPLHPVCLNEVTPGVPHERRAVEKSTNNTFLRSSPPEAQRLTRSPDLSPRSGRLGTPGGLMKTTPTELPLLASPFGGETRSTPLGAVAVENVAGGGAEAERGALAPPMFSTPPQALQKRPCHGECDLPGPGLDYRPLYELTLTPRTVNRLFSSGDEGNEESRRAGFEQFGATSTSLHSPSTPQKICVTPQKVPSFSSLSPGSNSELKITGSEAAGTEDANTDAFDLIEEFLVETP